MAAIARTLLLTLMLSAVLVATAAMGVAISGRPVAVTGADVALLGAALWTTLFLAFVVLNGVRETLLVRDSRRPPEERRGGVIVRRCTIAAAALSLALGSLSMMYLKGELTRGSAVFAVVWYAGTAVLLGIAVETVLHRRDRRAG